MVDALGMAGGGGAGLLGVSGANLDRARLANTSALGSPTLPAHHRYTGVVWDHMCLDDLGSRACRRASESIVVLSGLLGLVAFDDPVPDYKLKMGGSLPGIGRLSTFWRGPLSHALNNHLDGAWVVDLLPVEHRAAWTPDPHRYAGLSVVSFVESSGKVAGHDAKAAKGHLIRHLLESTGPPEAALASWRHPRFTLSY